MLRVREGAVSSLEDDSRRTSRGREASALAGGTGRGENPPGALGAGLAGCIGSGVSLAVWQGRGHILRLGAGMSFLHQVSLAQFLAQVGT